MKKKSKFGFNTGNTLLRGIHSVRSRRFSKDQCTVVKTFRNRLVHHGSALQQNTELNKKIIKTVDNMVQDGDVNGTIEYDHSQNRFSWRNNVLVYSLNKRKRWLLPERLLGAIDEVRRGKIAQDSVDSSQDPMYNVTLLERNICFDYGFCLSNIWVSTSHKINDSVSYSSSQYDQSLITPEKSYSSESDLKARASQEEHIHSKAVARQQRRKNHNQHFRDLQRNERIPWQPQAPKLEPAKIPEVHYEICYPQMSPCRSHYIYKEPKKKNKHGRNKGRHHDASTPKALLELAESCRDYDAEVDSEVSEQNIKCEFEPILKQMTYSFEACVDNFPLCSGITKKRRKKLKVPKTSDTVSNTVINNASSKQIKTHGKKSVIYMEEDSERENTMGIDPVISPSVVNVVMCDERNSEIPSLSTKFNRNSLCYKTLESHFGDAYWEGCCLPRRLTINMSQYVSNKCSWNRQNPREEQLLIDFTIFEENNNETEECHMNLPVSPCTTDISFHGRYGNINLSDIHSQFLKSVTSSSSPTNLILVVDDLANMLLDRSPDYFSGTLENLSAATCIQKCKYRYFRELNTWKMQCYTASQACDIMSELPLSIHQKKLKKHGSVSVVSNATNLNCMTDMVCDICMDTVLFSSNSKLSATALSSCKHWFCNECWKDHLIEGIQNGVLTLECPSYECNAVVDHVTLLSQVGSTYYNRHWHHVQHTKIEQRPDWKWCPSTHCSRVVHASSVTDNTSVSRACVQCTCLHTWCFDCQKEPHWPVSCDISDKYTKLVGQEEADKDKIFFVEVKKCPKCCHPINKNGGCQHMYCRCGFSFCWECLAAWSDHGSTLTCPKAQVSLTTLELENTTKLRMKEEYFSLAKEYRKKKNLLNYCTLKIKGRVIQVLLNTSRRESQHRKKVIEHVTKQPVFFNSYDLLMESRYFLYDVYHLLEYSCVWVSQSTSRPSSYILEQINLLALFAEKFANIIFTDRISSVEKWLTNINELRESVKSLFVKVSRRIVRADH